MIEPMKKVTVVCLAGERSRTVAQLAELGIVHAHPVQLPRSEELTVLHAEHEELRDTLSLLPDRPDTASVVETLKHDLSAVRELVASIYAADHALADLRKEQQTCRDQLQSLQPWGHFDPDTLRDLERRGLELVLFRHSSGPLPEMPADVLLQEISRAGAYTYYAVVASKGQALPVDPLPLPEAGDVAALNQELQQLEQRISQQQLALQELARQRPVLEGALRVLDSRIEFREACDGMGAEGSLAYLQGYVPENACDPLWESARRQGWGLLVQDPGHDEKEIPTLLRLPRWAESVRLIFQGLGVIPGYREIDISAWFLVFFSLFFAILIGDAGYGAIFLVATLLLRKKYPRAPSQPFWLFGQLAICTILWGVLSGTYFGWTGGGQKIALVESLTQEATLQKICFGLGALHLIIAHLWNALLIGRRTRALSELGWVVIFVGNYFLAAKMVLGEEVSSHLLWSMFVPGMVAVVLFSKPSYNPLKAIAGGLGSLAMNLINSFVDLVSYIRLFAVSAATVAVAASFNDMALGLELAPFWKGLMMALILVFGHGLNILLGAMGVLVHGVRLNMLEFSGHLGMEWAGVAYRPLKNPPEDSP
jgi:V/A-type H+-transporting ATPase subunit I